MSAAEEAASMASNLGQIIAREHGLVRPYQGSDPETGQHILFLRRCPTALILDSGQCPGNDFFPGTGIQWTLAD